jgi:hypothetical protein
MASAAGSKGGISCIKVPKQNRISKAYIMRHGFKKMEGEKSIHADESGDENTIHIDKTKKALKNTGIVNNINEIYNIYCSPRQRAVETAQLLCLKRPIPESTDYTENITVLKELSDIVIQSETERSTDIESKTRIQYKNIFSPSMCEYGKWLASKGVSELERLKEYFFSDPLLPYNGPISEEIFSTTLPAYEVGKRAYCVFDNMREDASGFKEKSDDKPRSGRYMIISHSLILEPLIAYSIAEALKDPSRNLFYEILDEFMRNNIQEQQWDFVEPATIHFNHNNVIKIDEFRGKVIYNGLD